MIPLRPSGMVSSRHLDAPILPLSHAHQAHCLALQAMAQSAQAAARLVTLPLSVAASVPGRVAPQYHDIGQTLYVLPGLVTHTKPEPAPKSRGSRKGEEAAGNGPALLPRSRSAGALPAADDLPAAAARLPLRPRLRRTAASSAALQSAAADGGSSSSDEDESEEDVAVAAQAVAAAAVATTAQEGGDLLAPMQLPPRTLFPMHRMLSYRNRILGIVAGKRDGSPYGQ
jgi:hypothetical protein